MGNEAYEGCSGRKDQTEFFVLFVISVDPNSNESQAQLSQLNFKCKTFVLFLCLDPLK